MSLADSITQVLEGDRGDVTQRTLVVPYSIWRTIGIVLGWAVMWLWYFGIAIVMRTTGRLRSKPCGVVGLVSTLVPLCRSLSSLPAFMFSGSRDTIPCQSSVYAEAMYE